jgi:RimJ/RimL family protein N-acetyltransferase
MPSTERLLLRDTRLSDAPVLFAILGDRQAMQYTTHFPTLRECRRHIAGYLWERRRNGHAPWTIATRANAEIIGWGGLYEDPFDRGWGIEVGYWFARSAWGRGYASELVRASLDHARRCGLGEVSAFARPENLASCRVLEKAGFRKERFVQSLQRTLYRRRFD